MFDNWFNILLHSKVLNNTFQSRFFFFFFFFFFLILMCFSVLKANELISYLFALPQSVIFRFYM